MKKYQVPLGFVRKVFNCIRIRIDPLDWDLDPEAGDFGLKAGILALKLGFGSWGSNMGLRLGLRP